MNELSSAASMGHLTLVTTDGSTFVTTDSPIEDNKDKYVYILLVVSAVMLFFFSIMFVIFTIVCLIKKKTRASVEIGTDVGDLRDRSLQRTREPDTQLERRYKSKPKPAVFRRSRLPLAPPPPGDHSRNQCHVVSAVQEEEEASDESQLNNESGTLIEDDFVDLAESDSTTQDRKWNGVLELTTTDETRSENIIDTTGAPKNSNQQFHHEPESNSKSVGLLAQVH